MTEKEEFVRKGYNKIAKEYQANRHIFKNSKELEEFASSLSENAKILDVGCGAGVPVTKFLVECGFDVTGVDFSEGMLKLARKNVSRAKFIKKDMTKMDFKDDSFDGLTAFSVFHVPKEKHFSLFKSFSRILKDQGIMMICIGGDEWEGTAEYFGTEMFWSHYSSEKSLKLVKDAGFQIIWDKHLVRGGEEQYWILARNKK